MLNPKVELTDEQLNVLCRHFQDLHQKLDYAGMSHGHPLISRVIEIERVLGLDMIWDEKGVPEYNYVLNEKYDPEAREYERQRFRYLQGD